MRKILISAILLLFSQAVISQPIIYISDQHDFTSPIPYLSIDTSQTSNVWQIGQPSKTIFDSAFTGSRALITDSMNLCQGINLSSLVFRLQPDTSVYPVYWIGTGFIEFMHKYDFDSLHSGGIIEIQYNDTGQWISIIDDLQPCMPTWSNLYSEMDTLMDGTYAITGKNHAWKWAFIDFQWALACKDYWIIPEVISLRFSYLSDSVAQPGEGWMIDDLKIDIIELTGGISTMREGHFKTMVYPNPVRQESVRISWDPGLSEIVDCSVYNAQGGSISTITNHFEQHWVSIDCSRLPSGNYLYQIITESGKISSGKFIILN